jgi:hypothetical protein
VMPPNCRLTSSKVSSAAMDCLSRRCLVASVCGPLPVEGTYESSPEIVNNLGASRAAVVIADLDRSRARVLVPSDAGEQRSGPPRRGPTRPAMVSGATSRLNESSTPMPHGLSAGAGRWDSAR